MNTTIVSRLADYTKTGLYNGTIGVWKDVYACGPLRDMYRLVGVSAFEKLTKFVLATFDLLDGMSKSQRVLSFFPRFPQGEGAFNDFYNAVTDHKDLLYAALSYDSLKEFVHRDRDSLRISLKFPSDPNERTVTNYPRFERMMTTWSKTLLCVGNFFETGKFLQKKNVFDFTWATEWANWLSTREVKGYYPFTYLPLSAWTDKPKEFFVFTASVIEIIQWSFRFFCTLGTDSAHVDEIRRNELLSSRTILKLTCSFGKIGLISNSKSYNTLAFQIMNFVTQSASLLKHIIDDKRTS